MITRHEAREQAFCLLFEQTFSKESLENIIDNAVEGRDLEVGDYALRLGKAVEEHCQELDALLQPFSTKWELNRLSRVTLVSLRVAACEIRYFEDIPVSVSINEAVELAKKFGTEDDSSYVNGVLGSLVRQTSEKKGEPQEKKEENPSD